MEEFVKGCLEDPELVRLLNTGGVEVGEGDEEEDEAAVDPEEELEKLNHENGKEDANEDGAKDEEEKDE